MRARDIETEVIRTHKIEERWITFARMRRLIGGWDQPSEGLQASVLELVTRHKIKSFLLVCGNVFWNHLQWDAVGVSRHLTIKDGLAEWHILRPQDFTHLKFLRHTGESLEATYYSSIRLWRVVLEVPADMTGAPVREEIPQLFERKLGR